MTVDQVIAKVRGIIYTFTDKEKARLLKVKTDNLTYLATKDVLSLYRAAKQISQSNVKGLFVEAGSALGGSAIIIAQAKDQQREFRVYDAFGMIPPPSNMDDADVHARYDEIKSGKSSGIGNGQYYGYTENLEQVVASNLAKHGVSIEENNIRLVKGYFENTLSIEEPVAFAHIDCDWYESVKICLQQIVPHLSVGGKIIFDDYYEWSGCRHAVDEYFLDKRQDYEFTTLGKKLHVVKIPA